MKCLLIEDDPDKASKIINFINENFQSCHIAHRVSFQSGLQAIFDVYYDFILLDMSLPTYDQGNGNFSGKPKNFGGRDILKEMKRYKKKSRVKIITQYNEFDGGESIKEIDEQLRSRYPEIYEGYIYYRSKNTEWENELLNFIKSINL